MKTLKRASTTLLAALVASLALPGPVMADPPAHAPAHGWRKKNDPYYVGYTGRQWSDDYGIRDGRCDRDRAGAALGAVVGGAIGAAVSDDDDRLIAILAGATIGAVIGHEIGDEMDDDDRACFGHSLELLEDGHKVVMGRLEARHAVHAHARPPIRARRSRLPPLHAAAGSRWPEAGQGSQCLPVRRRRLANDQGVTRSHAAG